MKLTQGKINELLSETACEHNHHHHKDGQKKNKACSQQAQPGAAQGGCAFDGASIALVPITDVAHLVHAPIACGGNSWGARGSLSSGSMMYKMGFTTDLSENDIIFGGEKKLYKAILEVQQRYQPAAVFVYNTCVTALIGDDLEAVCQKAAERTGIPVVPINSPGFAGTKNLGNRMGGEALLEYVIGTAEPEYTTPYDINLIGEYNIVGEMWSVLPLFEKLGIRVLSKITGDATYKEVCYAHRAKLNVLICSKALINVARKMEERYGIPYTEESFYGIADMNQCLRNIAAKLGDRDLQERVEKLIAEESANLDRELAPYRDRLKGKKVVLYTGGVKSWSIISAAKDLGMEVVATSTKKSTEEDKAKIRALLSKDGIMMEKGNAQELLKTIAKTQADMLIAGGRNQYTALKARIPFLDINQERHHPYAGYVGMIEIARELEEALYSPIWAQVCQPAPWEDPLAFNKSLLIESHAEQVKTDVITPKKSVTVNALKQSQPLGASLAFLGLKGAMPLMHGSQGCTAFAKVQLVRHFREAIPLATTAMTEVTTILGGEDNIEQAILTLVEKAKPEIIGLCTTGLTETRGDDMEGILKTFRQKHPELDKLAIASASTPDFKGALQDGYAAAIESIVRSLPQVGTLNPQQITVLAGSALAPGDIQELKEMITTFGLSPIFIPDLSSSMDGHLNESYSAVTTGGTTLEQIQSVGDSIFTLALGESMRTSATILQERFGTDYQVFDRLTGLRATDLLLQQLYQLSGFAVPEKYRYQRQQLQDAMLDTHFYFGRKRVSLALEPDLLYSIAWWLSEMGAEVQAAVTTTRSPLLEKLPIASVTIGDLEDFENLAAGSDLMATNSNGKRVAMRLGIPLYRIGFPILDRLGNGHRSIVGYRGTMEMLFELGNIWLEAEESAHSNILMKQGES